MDKHYELLGSIMRVICTAVLSRGSQNEQTLDQGRIFLLDNRLAILAVLKKSAGIGAGAGSAEQSIGDLAESYMLLMSVTGFLEVSVAIAQFATPSMTDTSLIIVRGFNPEAAVNIESIHIKC